jgi:ABC-type amino acid transport substrate-binding protein
MRSAIFALAGFALAGSFAFAQPSDGRLKIIHENATLRVAYRADSRPFSYVDAQGQPVGYTIELCERIAKSLEAQLNVALTIKWVAVDERTRFDAIVNDRFRDRREGIAALARGDLDGFASDKFVLLALARAENLRDFTLLPDDLSFEPFAIMLPRGDWAFRLAVNTALAHVFRSGEILGLYTKYLGGVGLGASNWAGVVFMFGGLPE